jgi:hypothetical protein
VIDAAMGERHEPALPKVFDATIKVVLFDLDGVVTRTAALHARAWKRLFDEFLAGLEGGSERLARSACPRTISPTSTASPATTVSALSCNRAASTCRGAIRRIGPMRGPSAVWATARTDTFTRC